MSSPAVTTKIHETFDVHGYFASSVTFDDIVIFNNGSNSIHIISA